MIQYATLERRPGSGFSENAPTPNPYYVVRHVHDFCDEYTRRHGKAALKRFFQAFTLVPSVKGDAIVLDVRELTDAEIAERARLAAPPRPGARIREHAAYLNRLRARW